MAKNLKRIVDRVAKEHQKWLADGSEEIRTWAVERIEARLEDGSLQSLRGVSSSLDALANYYAALGISGISNGNNSSWIYIHHSCLCHLWVVKIESSLFQRLANSSGLDEHLPQAANSLCYSIAVNLGNWRQFIAEVLSDMATDRHRGMVDPRVWKQRTFEPFAIRLNHLLSPNDLCEFNCENIGVYAPIFEHWKDEEFLRPALIRICDYHCENMRDVAKRIAEFHDPPFDLIPWEILAIRQVRQQQGLSTPEIDHPLAAPVFMNPPAPEPIDDGLIPRIEKLYMEYFKD